MNTLILAPVICPERRSDINKTSFNEGPYAVYPHLPAHSSFIDLGLTYPKELDAGNFDAFRELYSLTFKRGRRPVTIGGDHGISTPASSAFLESERAKEAVIVRLDRDLDCGVTGIPALGQGLWEERCVNDEFDEAGMGYLLSHFPDATYIHIGSPVPYDYEEFRLTPSLMDHTGRAMRNISENRDAHFITADDDLEKALGDLDHAIQGKAVYLSVDLDCYRDVNAEEFRFTPFKGWMETRHVAEVMEWLGQAEVKGMDLCEITNMEEHTAGAYAVDTYTMARDFLLD